MHRITRIAAMAAAATLAAAGTNAQTNDAFTFSGVVTYISGNLAHPWNQAQVGDPWKITYRFDPDAPDLFAGPEIGSYTPLVWYELTIGAASVAGPLTPQQSFVNVFNGQPVGVDQYEVWIDWQDQSNYYGWFMQLDDGTGTAWDKAGLDPRDALPRCGQIDLDWFNVKDFMFFDHIGQHNWIWGSIDSFSCGKTADVFGGLHFEALGAATLNRGQDGNLLVGNLGPSGNDGYAVLLGDHFDHTGPQGMGIILDKNPPPPTCWPNYDYYATTTHSTGDLYHVFTVRDKDCTGGGGVALLNASIENVVPYDKLTVVVLKDGQRVHSESVVHELASRCQHQWQRHMTDNIRILGPACGYVKMASYGPLGTPKYWDFFRFGPRGWEVGLATLDGQGNEGPVTLRLPSGKVVVGDTLWVHPVLPDPFEAFSMKDFAGVVRPGDYDDGVGELSVLHPFVSMFGGILRQMGEATFGFGSGEVTMSNLGDTGNDGLSIDIAPAKSGGMVVDTADLGANAQLRSVARGTVSGAQDAFLSAVTFEQESEGTRLAPDFTGLGASGYAVTVYNDDEVVRSDENPQTILIKTDVGGVIIWWDTFEGDHWSDIWWRLILQGGGIVVIDDGNQTWEVMGDRIELTPIDPQVRPDSVDRIELTASDMAAFTVSDFTYEPIPTCRPDVNGDGTVNTLDFIVFLNAWSSQSHEADWNGDGAVNTLDFVLFLNDWAEAVLNGGLCP